MDEATGELGSDFSVEVARAWEHELFAAPTPVRKVALRMAIVLGPGGGALNPFVDLARLGLGGRMGDGGHVFSWVHVDDVARAVAHLYDRPGVDGPVNLATPHPVSNTTLMAAVRSALGRPHGLPTPRAVLELGARIIRTEPELVLKSRWVHPGALLDSGFRFTHPTLPEAMAEIARDTPRGLLPVALGWRPTVTVPGAQSQTNRTPRRAGRVARGAPYPYSSGSLRSTARSPCSRCRRSV